MSDVTYLTAPREGVNDDVVRVVQWNVADGARVSLDQIVVVVETTKAAIDLVSPAAGYLFHHAERGAEVPVGANLAVITTVPQRPVSAKVPKMEPQVTSQVITEKARPLMLAAGLTAADFPSLCVIRASDVEAILRARTPEVKTPPRSFRGEQLGEEDWDEILRGQSFDELQHLLTTLRRRMKGRFNRHVPTGSLLHDRWQLAKDHGFGEGTSVYDECLILGDVQVGKNCWIGPYTVLDGQGGLAIGDFVDIGTGAHIYTHNTIERALTGHAAPMHLRPTKIGNCCFIAPHAMIGPGTELGDHCFVAAGSYVEGVFPAKTFIAGTPARRAGHIELRDGRAHVHMSGDQRHAD